MPLNSDYPTGPDAVCTVDETAPESDLGTFTDPECAIIHSATSGPFLPIYVISAAALVLTLLHALQRYRRFRSLARDATLVQHGG